MTAVPDTVIILCGGSLNTTNLPIGTNVSNAMVPVNGKPVIAWIIDDLIRKGATAATVVMRQDNDRLRLFLARAYERRLAATSVVLDRPGSILNSLAAGLDGSALGGSVGIVLGDTLISDTFDGSSDFVCVGEVDDSSRWCIVHTSENGSIVGFTDKREIPGRPHLAAAGYYQLRDGAHLRECVAACLQEGRHELSEVLVRYSERYPLHVQRATQWLDFGHVDNFARAKRTLLQSRFFNSLCVNPVLNTITKISTDNAKLEDELQWYLTIPDELRVLTPRIVSHRRVNGSLEIVQEYYGYPTLAELFVYSDLPSDAWRTILTRVLGIHQELRRYPGDVSEDDATEMYARKTLRRLDELAATDAWWADHLAKPQMTFNGRHLRSGPELRQMIEAAAQRLARSVCPSIIHGDLCFSNVLFDFTNQIIRLIDPRGRFGRRSIFGDARYDIAKLRHSVHGLYDFIMADMFRIEIAGTDATGAVFVDVVPRTVAADFDSMVAAGGYDLRQIQLIEGLLFLSMLPLHQGHRRRQQMMYYTGLELLNEVL